MSSTPSARERKKQLLIGRFEQEAEAQRRRVALQLHDNVGQSLTLFVLLLDQLDHALSDKPPEALSQLQDIARELVSDVRSISLDVRPAVQEKVGLLPTLEGYLQDLEARTGVQSSLTHPGLERTVPGYVANSVFQMAQKAADSFSTRSRRIRISVRFNKKSVTLSVAAVRPARGVIGADDMEWIRDRAEYLGGTYNLSATDGAGARMTVRLPVLWDQPA